MIGVDTDSPPSQGTATMFPELPVARLPEGSERSRREATLLLMSQDEGSLARLTQFLGQAGYQRVLTCSSIEQVSARVQEHTTHVVILDVDRPDMSALQSVVTSCTGQADCYIPMILMSGPVDEATRLRALDLGVDVLLVKPVNPRELLLRIRNALNLRLIQYRLAYFDPLTGLPNRATFMQMLEFVIHRRHTPGMLAALFHIDLDRFKQINEVLGHRLGDELLRAVASRLEEAVRSCDTVVRHDESESTLSHLGGDEFSILALRLRHPEDAGAIARRILSAMSQPFHIAGRDLYVTPSVGIALYPADGEDVATLLKHADTAMEQAKRNGGNRYDFYSSKLNKRSLERLSLENALRKAIERNELVLYFQPQVDVQSRSLVGVEALVRWQHPSMGFIGPQHFIPVAEESGLIIDMGRWVMLEACRQAKRWMQDTQQGLRMSVNVSPLQFRQGQLDRLVRWALEESGLEASLLTLELTESSIMSNVDENLVTLRALKGLGVDLSVDDFGTGFSSLSYLQRFPLTELKIDRSFTADLVNNPKTDTLVSSIIGLAQGLGLRVVAEGVETEPQCARLHELGCHYCQGYLFSPPLPAERLTADLLARTDSREGP